MGTHILVFKLYSNESQCTAVVVVQYKLADELVDSRRYLRFFKDKTCAGQYGGPRHTAEVVPPRNGRGMPSDIILGPDIIASRMFEESIAWHRFATMNLLHTL